MARKEDLLPTKQILKGIFPDIRNLQDSRHTVICNTWETCTFRLQLASEPEPSFPRDLLIRLEATESSLDFIAAFQDLAHQQLGDIVPVTLEVGTTADSKGELAYSIMPFFAGTNTLDDIWNDLVPDNQASVMSSIVDAMQRLQKVNPRNDAVRQMISKRGENDLLPSADMPIGDSKTGYYPNIKQLLIGLVEKPKAEFRGCEVLDTDDGIAIQSHFEDIGRVELSGADLDELHAHTVFSHNDLEPRNILVNQSPSNNGSWYVVAIIDWELAGFYPFAYEFGLKDTNLGSPNCFFNWYSLFKERSAFLLPDGECHVKMIQALRIIVESRHRMKPTVVSTRVRDKWIERQRVKLSSDVRRGWIREAGAGDIRPFGKQDQDRLVVEVCEELGRSYIA